MCRPSAAARLFAAASLLLAAPAWAQDPLPERLSAAAAVEATRWPASVGGENPVTIRLEKGVTVDILTQNGEQLRVRQGLSFGWVARDQLTETVTPKIELGAPPPGFR